MNLKLFPILFFILLASSCKTPKDVLYLQDIDRLTPAQLENMHQLYNTQIDIDDMLHITVTAPDPMLVTPFNPPAFAYETEGEQALYSAQSLYAYFVDKNGYINFPVLGEVYVKGLTKLELSKKLEVEISKYVENPLVSVQIANFKITVLGEVGRPASYTIRTDRISILDLMGMAGDLGINANRKNILVIRETDGVKTYGRIDLTTANIFESPFYYLKQNDVVYVEPNKAKIKNANYSQSRQYTVTVFSTILSALSVITAMVISIANASK